MPRENESEERDANWLMGDQLMEQWDEVTKDEEEITVERRLQVEKVQNTPRPISTQTHTESRLVHKDSGGGCKQAGPRTYG